MIDTPRLRLRPHRVADFERYLSLFTLPEPPDTAAPMNLSAEDTWARLLRWVGHWFHFGYGPFVVEDRATGDIVGEGGVGHFHRGMGQNFDDAPEAGWRVLATRRGEGIAAECMQGALDWFDREVGTARTVCMIHAANVRSIRVATKLGYRQFGTGKYRNGPVLLFERLR